MDPDGGSIPARPVHPDLLHQYRQHDIHLFLQHTIIGLPVAVDYIYPPSGIFCQQRSNLSSRAGISGHNQASLFGVLVMV